MATAAPKLKTVTDQAAQEAAPPKKSKLPLMIAIACIVIIGGGGAAWYFTSQGTQQASNKPAEVVAPVFLVLEPFTVNLRSDSEEQFLQVALTLQVKKQEEADQLKLYMPEVRNRMLLLLSSKSGAEILTPEGKKKLADEIIVSLKQPFAGSTKVQGLSNVFFTSFVVQ